MERFEVPMETGSGVACPVDVELQGEVVVMVVALARVARVHLLLLRAPRAREAVETALMFGRS